MILAIGSFLAHYGEDRPASYALNLWSLATLAFLFIAGKTITMSSSYQFLHCFRVYFASWKCFYPSPSLSRFPASLRARRKKLRQEKKVWGRRKKYQAGEKGFFFLLVRHSGFRLTRLNDQIALWSSGDLLILKLPFAVRPGLTGSRVSKDAKQFRLNL